jgi:hypothetical protein
MNKFASLIVLAVLFPLVGSAASFEGKVNFKMSSPRGQPQEISYNIKGDKIRVEMPGQNAMGGMIMDLTKKEMTMIMNEQKMYMTMAMPDATPPASTKKSDEVKLEKTGDKETIHGHSAEKYIATSADSKTELWLGQGLGSFMMAKGNPMGRGRGSDSAMQAWERALAGKELFPLRVIGKDKDGKETFRMEATAIEKTSLPDSMFTPPPGFQKFDMGGMMKGMIPGRP